MMLTFEDIRTAIREWPQLATALRLWHEKRGYECSAHSEGQTCCIDLILEEPAVIKTEPARPVE